MAVSCFLGTVYHITDPSLLKNAIINILVIKIIRLFTNPHFLLNCVLIITEMIWSVCKHTCSKWFSMINHSSLRPHHDLPWQLEVIYHGSLRPHHDLSLLFEPTSWFIMAVWSHIMIYHGYLKPNHDLLSLFEPTSWLIMVVWVHIII